MMVAFFAFMGGFCIEINTVNGPIRKTLSLNGLCRTRTMKIVHDYSLSEIKDKSKASTIAKAVTIFQTTWILLQCLGRVTSNIHITFLEVNTAVHVVIAIVMYAIWWHKPLDVGRVVTLERYGLGMDDSATTIYVEGVAKALKAAGEFLKPFVESLETHGVEALDHDGKPMLDEKGKIIYRKIGVPISGQEGNQLPQNRKSMLAALAIFKTVEDTPTIATKGFMIVPDRIKKYAQNVLRKDVISAITQSHGMKNTVPKPVSQAAYHAAFDRANKTAFQVAHEEIHKIVSNYNINSGFDQLGDALSKAFATTRRATFQASFRAAFDAVIPEVKKDDTALEPSATDSNNHHELQHEQNFVAGPNNTASPASEAHQQAPAPEMTSTLVPSASSDTGTTPEIQKIQIKEFDNIPASSPLRFASRSASASTSASTAADSDLKLIQTQKTEADTFKKPETIAPFIAAFRAANAATRAASRHAIRIAALDASSSKNGVVNAATSAFRNSATKIYAQEFTNMINDDINKATDIVHRESGNAFREHLHTSPRVGSDLDSMKTIVRRVTATGIFSAARVFIEIAKNDQVLDSDEWAACKNAEDILMGITDTKKSWFERYMTSFSTAWEIIGYQIIRVPGLFAPVYENSENGTPINSKNKSSWWYSRKLYQEKGAEASAQELVDPSQDA